MREPGQLDWWAVVGVMSAAVSGYVAFEIGLKHYVVCGFLFGAVLKLLLLTRWRSPREGGDLPSSDWFYVVLWPVGIVGFYWVAKKGEENRRERIVREVMES